ncbi:MAG: GGDEF domain-containing protein, partial [Dethiobacteria bacterium]
MKKFELERLQKIEEISPIIRTVTIILVAVALFTSFSFEFTFPWLGIPPLALFLFIVVFEKIRLLFFPLEETTPTLINYLGLLFNTLFIVFVVILTGGPISPFKILFLPVILLYTLKFGTLWGVAVSTIASACLLLLHLREANILASPNAYLEADFITVSMFFMTSWLIGTISGTERTIRSRLTEQANRDALTGLYSHRYFHQVLEKKIQEHKSHKKIGLIMLDLDHFNY